MHLLDEPTAGRERIARQLAYRLDITATHSLASQRFAEVLQLIASRSAKQHHCTVLHTGGVARTQRPATSDALRLARNKFLAPERIDMSALADELSINRVTLYRWVGSRDRLLVEVAWSLTNDKLTELQTHTQGHGAERIIAIITGFLQSIIANPGMHRWLTEEGEHALRLLTRDDTEFQPRLTAAIHDLLEEEAAAGTLDLPVDLHELAYLIVRMIEFYAYLPLITGEPAHPNRAQPILRMLLTQSTSASSKQSRLVPASERRPATPRNAASTRASG